MKIFIWKLLDKVSENYHSGGGLIVIAKDFDRAKELIAEKNYISIMEEEIDREEGTKSLKEVLPDLTLSIMDDAKEDVIIFPDAGCC